MKYNLMCGMLAIRYGHLGMQSLAKLSSDKLVSGFNYKVSKQKLFCEHCAQEKLHRSSFPKDGAKRAEKPLKLVHCDVCGKMNTKSLGGAEYLLTFIDDETQYVWVYFLKTKDEVFKCFNLYTGRLWWRMALVVNSRC